MIYLFGLIPLAILIWGIIEQRGGRGSSDGDGYFQLTFGSILSVVFFISLPLISLGNGSDLVKLETFYKSNNQNYQITIDKTASYLSIEEFTSQVIAGSIEKTNLAQSVSTRLAEWRDRTNEYNLSLASMQYLDRNIWVGILYPNKVQDLKLLILK